MKIPRCGSQCFLCDLPVRMDTYEGCSHGCKYCFAKKFVDIRKIKNGESPETLRKFIEGNRNSETKWCDWNIPIHWGGMSDPFQPVEKIRGISKECLKIFKETQYPFVVSTKGKLVIEEEYLNLLKDCNCVVQISMVCSKYDVLEQGCPSFNERLKIVEILSKNVKRVIIRIQPYMHEVYEDVFKNLELFKKAGAYGVIVEGMKYSKKKEGLIKIGGDFVYPYEIIKNDFLNLKKEAHRLGLKIYAGENRIRALGDSLTCCGIDRLEDFKQNTFNLNHILNGDKTKPTEKMKEKQTGKIFRSLAQTTIGSRKKYNQSFAFNMLDLYKTKKSHIEDVFGKSKK